jgi:hypothetical protein
MPFGIRDGRRQSLISLCAAVYAVFLVTAPFEHHDLVCHLKTPLHCTSCTGSVLGSAPGHPAVPAAWNLTDAGRVVGFHRLVHGFLLQVRSTGRSPPVFL